MRYRWFVREEDRTDEFGNPVSRAVHDEALQPKKTGYARGELLAVHVSQSVAYAPGGLLNTIMGVGEAEAPPTPAEVEDAGPQSLFG